MQNKHIPATALFPLTHYRPLISASAYFLSRGIFFMSCSFFFPPLHTQLVFPSILGLWELSSISEQGWSVTRLILTRVIYKVSLHFVFVSSCSEASCLVDGNRTCSTDHTACRGHHYSLVTKHLQLLL